MIAENVELGALRRNWRAGGFLHFKGVFSPSEVSHFLREIRCISGQNDASAEKIVRREEKPYVREGRVVANRNLWPLITNCHLLSAMRSVLGEEICFLGADAIYSHRSAIGFHRDTPIKNPMRGPDFDPYNTRYGVLRAIAYFHESEANEFLVVPGSHRLPNVTESPFEIEVKDSLEYPISIPITSGDAVIFDARLLHAGAPVDRPKYAAVWTYAARNQHSVISYWYGRLIRTDQTQIDFPSDLIEILKEHDLYWEELYQKQSFFEEKWRNSPKGRVFWAPYGEESSSVSSDQCIVNRDR